MKIADKWIKISNIIGAILLIVGAIDPLEGSVLIAAGSVLVTITSYLANEQNRKFYLIATSMILFGISFMFYFSSLGGIGGKSDLSWWWGTFILPYPIGWLALIILFIQKMSKKSKA